MSIFLQSTFEWSSFSLDHEVVFKLNFLELSLACSNLDVNMGLNEHSFKSG
jgi:hypothetical protein